MGEVARLLGTGTPGSQLRNRYRQAEVDARPPTWE